MNSDIIFGRWKQLKGRVCQALAEWSDNDCLSGVLQEDYGREQDEVSSGKTSH